MTNQPADGAAKLEAAAGPPGAAVPLPLPLFETPAHFLTTTVEIEALAEKLKEVPRFAVDMESDSFYHYFDKVCLFQITAEGEDYIVDALAGAARAPPVRAVWRGRPAGSAPGSCARWR